MSQFKRLVIVSTLFQVVWFAAVLGRESWQWVTAIGVMILLIGTGSRESVNWRHWLLLTVIGVALDAGNIMLGLLEFDNRYIPVWLMALWAAFCWYVQFLARALSQYPIWAVSMVGGCAGALSYLAGHQLGAVSLGVSLTVAFVVFFIEWFVFITLCMKTINVGESRDEKDSMV